MQLDPVPCGKPYVGQHIGIGIFHELRQLGHTWAGLVGHHAPLPASLMPGLSRLIGVPRVAECAVTSEYKVMQLKGHAGALVQAWLMLGEIVGVHIARRPLRDGVFNTFVARVVLRAGGLTAYAEIGPGARFDVRR